MDISDFVKGIQLAGIDHAVLKNWHQPTPDWQDFKDICDPFVGRQSFSRDRVPESMHYFLDESIKAYPDSEYSFFTMQADTFRNADPESARTSLHTDPYDILHWQCRGATEWTIGNNPEKIILEPGDLLWFRAETPHETENLTEKYSLIFVAGKVE